MIAPHLRKLIRRLTPDAGFALVLALGVVTTLTIAGTSAMVYSTRNETAAHGSRARLSARSLAEAGINNAMAVLEGPNTNALTSAALPGTETTASKQAYETGTAYWWGEFDAATTTWTLHGKGVLRNPAGQAQVVKYIRASTKIRGSLMQPANNPVWNYIVSLQTGSPCDMTLDNSMNMQSPLYVMGNLCLNTPSEITAGPLVVKGSVKLDVNTNIGTQAAPINEAHIVGGCSYKNGPWDSPCTSADQVFVTKFDTVAPPLTKPQLNLEYWYVNAAPGPRQGCTTSTGTPPVFDNDAARNNSVTTVFNLTPPTLDYSCVTKNWVGETIGELSWNHTTKKLTVNGTVFIDGSAKVEWGYQNVPIEYNGRATLYLSGTLLVKNTKFCGGLTSDGTNCDFANWNPNTETLVIVAAGSGGQLPAGDSIQVVSAYFQGGLWGEYNIELDTTSQTEGPMIAGTEVIGQKVLTHSFPVIEEIPVGAPGVPVVYADPDPPTNWTG